MKNAMAQEQNSLVVCYKLLQLKGKIDKIVTKIFKPIRKICKKRIALFTLLPITLQGPNYYTFLQL